MSRLQVGGLALVVNSVNPKNLGVVVTPIEGYKDGWIVEGELDSSHGLSMFKTKFYAPSAWLMPLGDKQTQEELRQESIKQKKQQERSERV